MDDNEKVTYFAETDHRNRKTKFGIKAKDRTKHTYVIGKTGMGKSTLLENMAVQDIQNGNGIAFIDPHGTTAEKLLDYIPEHRVNDVLYFAPFDVEHPVSFNVMEDVGEDKRHLVLDGLMSAFKKIWVDAWSARMEYILGNTILALLEYPDSTMLGINRMYTDKEYREKVVSSVQDPLVKAFWNQEFAGYTERYAQEATPAIQNKVGQFTANPLIRNIIGQANSSFDVRKIMDEKKIMIINLSKGRMGEQNANLLGSMLITKIYLAAMSRADLPAEKLNALPNFYLYVDEFQSFANESFANILSEARKYKLNLTIAHQYIEQMSEEVRAAVFGNVGTMVSFRVGSYDAEILEKEFAPQFTSEDMVNLGFAQIYLKLMVDGISSSPFSATTLPPIAEPKISYHDVAKARSRAQYATPRAEVEAKVRTEQDAAIQSASRNTGAKSKKQYTQSRPQTPPQSRTPEPQLQNTEKKPDVQNKESQKITEQPKAVVGSENHVKSLREVLEEAVGKDQIEKSEDSQKEAPKSTHSQGKEQDKAEKKEKSAEHNEGSKQKSPPEISKQKLRDLLHVKKEET
ncbi:MAG: type IV secretion system DNA-binding domain-containing protein [Candidatus Paceibacterota bacterium]